MQAVVAIDGYDANTVAALQGLNCPRVKIVETGCKQGPALTRLAAAQIADGEYLALLDDDDEWMPSKTQAQMDFISSNRLQGDFIISCRFVYRPSDDNGPSIIAPEVLYTRDMDMSEYLFDRRTPIARPGSVGSGTPLFPRSVVTRVPFQQNPLHDDLAWILDCVAGAKIPLYMIEEIGLIYILSSNSRNQTGDWRNSVLLARRYKAKNCMTPRAFAGLLSTSTAWRAKRKDGLSAIVELANIIRKEGKPTAVHWASLGIVALAPLNVVDRIRRNRKR
jgi:glycosyltransferase involved in cell wall biosynthesis